ncbi:MAG: inositol monophosphatase [Candidatus Sumerlaeia bacterium]|nr:inositol monophosphatase [Candidatus Sumerlaeia bacterium]
MCAKEPLDFERIEQVAREAHRAGGRILRRHFRRLTTIEFKGRNDADLITVADRESEAAIMAIIRRAFPDHGILAEESGESRPHGSTSTTQWVIDPLDGTTNFAHGLAYYSISIGVVHEGRTVLGSVSCPQLGEFFFARRGGGATLNGRPIRVSTVPSLQRSLVVTGFPYDSRQRADRYLAQWRAVMMKAHGLRRLGSAAIDLCYVAAGIFDAYYEESLNPWDWAPGALIVEEAGGRVTDYAGRPFDPDMKQCLATNGYVHDEMLHVLNV